MSGERGECTKMRYGINHLAESLSESRMECGVWGRRKNPSQATEKKGDKILIKVVIDKSLGLLS